MMFARSECANILQRKNKKSNVGTGYEYKYPSTKEHNICTLCNVAVGLYSVTRYTKYEVSAFTHYEDMKCHEKCKN